MIHDLEEFDVIQFIMEIEKEEFDAIQFVMGIDREQLDKFTSMKRIQIITYCDSLSSINQYLNNIKQLSNQIQPRCELIKALRYHRQIMYFASKEERELFKRQLDIDYEWKEEDFAPQKKKVG